MRSLMPGWTFNLWRGIETALLPFMDSLAMFAYILLEKRDQNRSTQFRGV
jgi:hypothetical protein